MTTSWQDHYARRAQSVKASAVRELLKYTEQPNFISLAGGLPDPNSFPFAAVGEAVEALLRDNGPGILQYGPTEGYRPLRELVAQRLSTGNLKVDVENVLITSGSQQALDLLGKVFLDRDDQVLVESPTYMAALQAWNAYEVSYLTVPMDDEGLDPDHLDPLLAQHPKLLYTIPNFQNPTGVTLSLERRRKLLDLAAAHNVPIVEDNPYGALRFAGEPVPNLLELAATPEAPFNGVLQLGTFSKTLAPGLRIGWVAGPADVIRRLVIAKQGVDLHTSSLDQAIAHHLVTHGQIEDRLPAITALYRERRDAMLEALTEHFPASARWTHPTGGMFVWVTLAPDVDSAEVLKAALEQGVGFVPGGPFHPDGSGKNTLRLNFSNATPDQLREGIARIGVALREF